MVELVSRELDRAIDFAINNFNNLGLTINFERASSNLDIAVKEPGGRPGGYAGFPPGDGSPYERQTLPKERSSMGKMW